MDYYSPKETAQNAVGIAVKKTSLSFGRMVVLGILAGAFIAFGAEASTFQSVANLQASCRQLTLPALALELRAIRESAPSEWLKRRAPVSRRLCVAIGIFAGNINVEAIRGMLHG